MTNKENDWTSPDNDREAAIKHLVENSDVSPLQAKELVEKHGTDIDALMEVAKGMKAES